MTDLEAAKTHQKIFLKELKSKKKPYKVKPEERILDLTTGSGVFAVITGLQGTSGIAVDIHKDAVRNAKENFKRFKININAIKSDLFENVPDEKLDWIFANGPYAEGKIEEPLQFAFFGSKSFLTRLFKQAPKFLKKNGKILITFAEWGELELFEKLTRKNGFHFKILAKKTSDNKRTYE